VAGKEKLPSFGVYPDVSLKLTCERRDEARRQLASGIDPSVKRRTEQIAESDSFEAVAREWFTKFSPNWTPSHSSKIMRRLEMDVFPWLRSRPVSPDYRPRVAELLATHRGARRARHCTPRIKTAAKSFAMR
jgi:hypothetical protein